MLGTGAGPGTEAVRDGSRMPVTVMATSLVPVACCSLRDEAEPGAGAGAGLGPSLLLRALLTALALLPRVPAGRELPAEPRPAP